MLEPPAKEPKEEILIDRGIIDPFEPIWDIHRFMGALTDWFNSLPEEAKEGFPKELHEKVMGHLNNDKWYEVAFSDRVPLDLVRALEAYANEGRELGGFLEAVVSNDLARAIAVADQTSRRCINGVLFFVWSMVPGEATGSKAAYDRWIDIHKPHAPSDLNTWGQRGTTP